MLVSRYKIELKEAPELLGATVDERMESLFQVKQGITIA